MSYGSAHLMTAMLDGLRYVLWVVVSGFAVVGAAFYGGAGVASVWQKAGPPARRRKDEVAREAAEGIAEIEAYLAGQEPGAEPPEPPPAPRRKRPPASGEAA
ncbi:hypothetical protein [Jiangella alkaliphila]|uniref:Uncharacterized protein n=1 Tax=Jiangella alkaliphila TaxID=419479 RepID=A0A1H2J8Y7_9ACTN|nr:hypothetical protein [Jiangella alkaliphila]SDU52518.1 hypothetical protein SAMN04488563_2405 [Jiangella alkaliphila]